MSANPPAIALMGPTASGKTRLAVQLAHALDGEIISVDSALVYRGMDIGTAKPGMAEREGVPHHLIDLIDPAEAFSTGQFRAMALGLMQAITARGKLPILAGGTMLYFNALFNGLAELPAADEAVRRDIDAEAERVGWAKLHEDLAQVDPQAAARIHPNDPQRIQRALEVYRLAGVSLSELCERGSHDTPPFDILRLVVAPTDREALHGLIRQRFLAMLEQGLVDEVRGLCERGDLHPGLPSIRAVGYRQVWAYLQGEYDYPQMVERGVIATRQFAKRQYTWLRREAQACHFVSEDADVLEQMLKAWERFLTATDAAENRA
jgi:tRNA dimethylallyltransferase